MPLCDTVGSCGCKTHTSGSTGLCHSWFSPFKNPIGTPVTHPTWTIKFPWQITTGANLIASIMFFTHSANTKWASSSMPPLNLASAILALLLLLDAMSRRLILTALPLRQPAPSYTWEFWMLTVLLNPPELLSNLNRHFHQPLVSYLPLFNQTASQWQLIVEYATQFFGPPHAGKHHSCWSPTNTLLSFTDIYY